jgi:uncharacterized membrane protein
MSIRVSSYLTALGALIAGDALWLSYFARTVFEPALDPILLETPRWWAAAAFYLANAFAVNFLAVEPSLRERNLRMLFFRGACLGLTSYATYDLTNLATIKLWTNELALIDVAWGTCLTTAAAMAAYFVETRFKPKPSSPPA